MKVADLFAALSMKINRQSLAMAMAELKRFAGAVGGPLKRALTPQHFGRDLRNYAKLGALGAGYALVQAGKNALAFEESLVGLRVASQHTVGSLEDVKKRVLEVSNSTGVAKETVTAIARQFVQVTGDGKGAMQMLERLTRSMVAAEAPAEDIATAAAAMSQQLGLAPDQMEKAFSIVSTAGKLGKVELKDFAGMFASTGALYKQFGDSQSLRGLSAISSALQFVAQDFGTPDEAAHGLQQMMGTLIAQAGKLKKVGVDIYEKDPKTGAERLKALSQIVSEIKDKNFNASELADAIGRRKEAGLALRALMRNRDAWFAMAKQIEAANNITEDYEEQQTSSAAKARKAWTQTKNAIEAAFTPERIEIIARAVSYLARIVGGLFNILVKVGEFLGELAAKIYESWMAVADAINAAIEKVKEFFSGMGEAEKRHASINAEASRLMRQGVDPAEAYARAQKKYGNKADQLEAGEKMKLLSHLKKNRAEADLLEGTGAKLDPDYYEGAYFATPTAPAAKTVDQYTYDVGGVQINLTTSAGDPKVIAEFVKRAFETETRKATAAHGGR